MGVAAIAIMNPFTVVFTTRLGGVSGSRVIKRSPVEGGRAGRQLFTVANSAAGLLSEKRILIRGEPR
jgi:hypothetical protein